MVTPLQGIKTLKSIGTSVLNSAEGCSDSKCRYTLLCAPLPHVHKWLGYTIGWRIQTFTYPQPGSYPKSLYTDFQSMSVEPILHTPPLQHIHSHTHTCTHTHTTHTHNTHTCTPNMYTKYLYTCNLKHLRLCLSEDGL